MIRTSRARSTVLAVAVLGFACGDAPSAPNGAEERVMVSLVGLTAGDAGLVLEISGGVETIDPARESIEVAWAGDPARSVTVAIVGPLAAGADVLVVRRRTDLSPLEVRIREIAGADGAVGSSGSVRAIVRPAD